VSSTDPASGSGSLETPPEVEEHSDLGLTRAGCNCYRLGLTAGRSLLIAPAILDQWGLLQRRHQEETVSATAGDLAQAVLTADDWVHRCVPDAIPLLDRGRGWRDLPASKAQRWPPRPNRRRRPGGHHQGPGEPPDRTADGSPALTRDAVITESSGRDLFVTLAAARRGSIRSANA